MPYRDAIFMDPCEIAYVVGAGARAAARLAPPSTRSAPASVRPLAMTLASDLQKLIEQSCSTAWSQFDWIRANAALYGLSRRSTDKWTAPGAPAFVAMLADSPLLRRRLARAIQDGLPPALCKGSPLVSGVFHADSPKVRFGGSASQVELADLLLVRHHFQTGRTRPEGRALLLRAKASTTPRSGRLTGRDAHQFDLHADWATPLAFPQGDFGPPPSGERWILAQGPLPQGITSVYGIVSSQRSCRGQKFPDNCPWAVGHALAPEPGHPRESRATLSLAAALDGFVAGRHGRPWEVVAQAQDHWSHFVREALERSVAWEHQVQRVGGVDLPRRRAALSYVQSFLAVEVNARLTSTIDREQSFEAYVEELIASVDSVGRQALEWALSDKSAEEPPAPRTTPEGPRGGLSVLYIATFGDDALAEPVPDWIPLPEPAAAVA